MPDEGGSNTQSFTSDGGSLPGDVHDGGVLLVVGEGMLTTFALVREQVVIGRDPECDVVIEHPTLSRRHALLRLGPPLSVQDLDSKNGTSVAGGLLERGVTAPLSVGESFHIGRFSLAVVRPPHARTRAVQGGAAEALRVIDPTPACVSPLVRDIAQSDLNVLILGETGVGKEVLAETIHRLSGRKGEFVCVNCAAIAPALIESELFGHEKGAFTGAAQSRPGLLEAAAGGTVFLDEVGELPAPAQAKLLRAIETREVLRVGAVRPMAVDLRFVAATNRDLPTDVASGHFRSDLLFRLDGVTLVIPPLRERRERIEPLALTFLTAALEKRGSSGSPRIGSELLARLQSHPWPGNVRELKAVLERAVLLARGGEIGPGHLALTPGAGGPRAQSPAANPPPAELSPREAEERQRIIDAVDACAGNQTRAAKALGISRATLVNKLAIYRIPRPRKGR